METPSIQSRARTPGLSLDRMANSPNVPRAERMGAAARAFEAVFLRQILDTAQKPLIQSGLETDSSSKAVYRDLINDTLADRIASSGQFGLAGTLIRDWNRQLPAEKSRPGSPDSQPALAPVPAVASTPEAAVAAAAARPQLKPFRHGPEPSTARSRWRLQP